MDVSRSHGAEPALRADLFEALLDVGRALAGADDPEQALAGVAETVGRAVSADAVVVGLFAGDGRALRVGGAYGEGGGAVCEPGMAIPLEHSAGDGTWLDGKHPILRAAAAFLAGVEHPMPARAPLVLAVDSGEAEPCTVGVFPIAGRTSTHGVLLVSLRRRGDWLDAAGKRLCEGVAEQIAAALEAASARARSEQRLAQMAAQASLVQMVLEGKGLAALTAALADLLGNPVVVADGVFHLVAYSPNQDRADRHRRESLVSGGTPRSVLDDPVVRQQFQRVAQLRAPLALTTFPQHGWVQRRIQAPILMGNELLGRVTVAEADRPFADSDFAVLRDATVALALELMKQRAALETEHRLRADFLRDLLSGPPGDLPSAIARAGFLGIDLLRPWDLLVVVVDEARGLTLDYEDTDQMVAKRRIFETVRHVAVRQCAQSVAVVHGESILVLVPTMGSSDVRALAEAIRQEITRVSLQATVSVGIGPTCQRIEDFSESYGQAKRALDVVRSLGRSNTVISLDDLGVYGMLFRSEDRGELARFADRMLGPLLEHDRTHGAALVETLHAFLEENGNHRRTAARLYVHVNTLTGRLERVAAVSNLDLDDSTTRLNLQLALHILRLTGAGPVAKVIDNRYDTGNASPIVPRIGRE